MASYNVHRCVGVDRRRDPARIAAVIRSLQADVVALQEVDGWPIDRELLGDGLQAVPGLTIVKPDRSYGNVVLTRLPILDVRRLELTVRRREPRGALDVELDAGGVRLRVIATHLGLAPGERRAQVRRILDLAGGDDARVTVLLGDINEWFMAGRPLRWLHARFGRGAGGRTYPSRLPLLALDRIWVRPREALGAFRIHATDLSRRASDHLPISAEIRLAPDDRGRGAGSRPQASGFARRFEPHYVLGDTMRPDGERRGGERSDGGDAFMADPQDGPARISDDLAESLAEEFLLSATSGDTGDEAHDQSVPEEIGGPFVETTAGEEFADGFDGSNPADATAEPLPQAVGALAQKGPGG